jgi:hypothetical protein
MSDWLSTTSRQSLTPVVIDDKPPVADTGIAWNDEIVWGLRGIATAANLRTSGQTRKVQGRRKRKPRPAGEPDEKAAYYLVKTGVLPAWRAGNRLFSFRSAIHESLANCKKAAATNLKPTSTEEATTV